MEPPSLAERLRYAWLEAACAGLPPRVLAAIIDVAVELERLGDDAG